MLQVGRRLRKSTGVMAGTGGDRRKSSTLPILLPDSRCRWMCWVMAGVSLARRPAAAAFDAFGGWCFVGGEVLAVRVSGRLALVSETGQYRLAGHDARNVKNQDLTPNMRWAAAVVCGPPWPIWRALTKWGLWHEEESAIYAALAGATPDHA